MLLPCSLIRLNIFAIFIFFGIFLLNRMINLTHFRAADDTPTPCGPSCWSSPAVPRRFDVIIVWSPVFLLLAASTSTACLLLGTLGTFDLVWYICHVYLFLGLYLLLGSEGWEFWFVGNLTLRYTLSCLTLRMGCCYRLRLGTAWIQIGNYIVHVKTFVTYS